MPKAVVKIEKVCFNEKCKKPFVDQWGTQKFCTQKCREKHRWNQRSKRQDKRGGYNRRIYITLWMKAMGLEVDSVPCHYCESSVSLDDFVIDHKVPSSELKTREAKQEIENLVISCKSCNAQKGVLPYDMFYTWKQSQVKPQEPDTPSIDS
tara:strand:+ start:92 stop:544 length:453 start_codon:yes stop_codon:yes gene_type:complete